MARVGAHLSMARIRKESEERLREAENRESIGLLAAGIAHDFNNLLTGIMGNASFVRSQLRAHPARVLLDEVLKASERAADLVRQLLAYSGKGHVIVEKLSLSSAAAEVISFLKQTIAPRIDFRLHLSSDLPLMESDPVQIREVIVNLVTNSAEAIGAHTPGHISITTAFRQLDDHFVAHRLAAWPVRSGPHAALVVEDTGAGMDRETMAHIFEPFFTTRFMGRGLGLAAVAGIVRICKGAILVESEPGRGTAVTVFFPALNVPKPEPKQLTVLVADDEDYIRVVMKASLEGMGLRVLLAKDGAQVISVFTENQDCIDLVILGLRMGKMSGKEVLTALKSKRSDLKVLVASGPSDKGECRLLTDRQISGIISKPFTASVLNEQVKSALAGSP